MVWSVVHSITSVTTPLTYQIVKTLTQLVLVVSVVYVPHSEKLNVLQPWVIGNQIYVLQMAIEFVLQSLNVTMMMNVESRRNA